MKLFAGLSAGTGKRRTGLEVLCDLAHEPLERELADQELSAAGGRRLSTAHTLIGSRSGGEASGFYPAHLWVTSSGTSESHGVRRYPAGSGEVS